MISVLCETYENFLIHVKYGNLVPPLPYSLRQILNTYVINIQINRLFEYINWQNSNRNGSVIFRKIYKIGHCKSAAINRNLSRKMMETSGNEF